MGSLGRMVLHSVLPPKPAAEVSSVLEAEGLAHVAHASDDPVAAGVAAASDADAVALIGPFRSREVAETVEATGPAGLPLVAPMATWAGVTRSDEPGCEDDPADHRGTVFRLVARDTEMALRIAADVRAAGNRAFVVAGEHEYGVQLQGSSAWRVCRVCPSRRRPTSSYSAACLANRRSGTRGPSPRFQ